MLLLLLLLYKHPVVGPTFKHNLIYIHILFNGNPRSVIRHISDPNLNHNYIFLSKKNDNNANNVKNVIIYYTKRKKQKRIKIIIICYNNASKTCR